MGDANDGVDAPHRPPQQLVRQHPYGIPKPKQTMVGPDGPYTQHGSVHDRFESHGRQCRVSVDEVDRFPHEQVAEVRQEEEEVG